jgi:hypothetical protein
MNEIILYNKNTNKGEKFKDNEKIIISLFTNNYIAKDTKTKEYISKIKELIPLYNIYHNTLFLVRKEEIYHYVFNKHYRLPNQQIYDSMKENNTKKDKDNIEFLNNYILDILEQTYLYLLYYYSDKFGKNITTCPKPSFIPYLLTTTPDEPLSDRKPAPPWLRYMLYPSVDARYAVRPEAVSVKVILGYVPLSRRLPLISNAYAGALLPMPTLPVLLMTMRCV